jgi:hypothetical protein
LLLIRIRNCEVMSDFKSNRDLDAANNDKDSDSSSVENDDDDDDGLIVTLPTLTPVDNSKNKPIPDILPIFDILNLKRHSCLMVIGPRQTGKTTLVQYLASCYLLFKPHIVTHPQKTQDYTRYEWKTSDKVQVTQEERYGSSQTLQILDDVLDIQQHKDKDYITCIMHRKLEQFFIEVHQSIITIPAMTRHQVDYLFLFHDSSRVNIEKIYRCFGLEDDINLPQFREVVQRYTQERYSVLVIHCLKNSNQKEPIFYKFRIPS